MNSKVTLDQVSESISDLIRASQIDRYKRRKKEEKKESCQNVTVQVLEKIAGFFLNAAFEIGGKLTFWTCHFSQCQLIDIDRRKL